MAVIVVSLKQTKNIYELEGHYFTNLFLYLFFAMHYLMDLKLI